MRKRDFQENCELRTEELGPDIYVHLIPEWAIREVSTFGITCFRIGGRRAGRLWPYGQSIGLMTGYWIESLSILYIVRSRNRSSNRK